MPRIKRPSIRRSTNGKSNDEKMETEPQIVYNVLGDYEMENYLVKDFYFDRR